MTQGNIPDYTLGRYNKVIEIFTATPEFKKYYSEIYDMLENKLSFKDCILLKENLDSKVIEIFNLGFIAGAVYYGHDPDVMIYGGTNQVDNTIKVDKRLERWKNRKKTKQQ